MGVATKIPALPDSFTVARWTQEKRDEAYAERERLLKQWNRGELALEGAEIDRLCDECEQLEKRAPAGGHPGFPAAGRRESLKDRERLTKGQSLTDWVKARGDRADYNVNKAWDAFARGLIQGDWQPWQAEFAAKSMSTVEPGGGYIVPDVLSSTVVDRMRSSTPIFEAGATVVPMSSSTLDIARITGDPTPAWRSELGAVSTSDATLDRIRFTARSLSFMVKASRELVEDTDNLGEVVQRAVAGGVGVELTRVALRGSGTPPEPRGIRNQTGVTLTALGTNGLAATWDTLINEVKNVETANAQPNALIWTPRTAAALASTKDTTGQYIAPPEPVANLERYKTTVIPVNLTKGTSSNATEIYTGDFRQLLVGMRTAMSIELLRERYADTGELAFWVWVRADIQLEHGEAFSVVTDAIN